MKIGWLFLFLFFSGTGWASSNFVSADSSQYKIISLDSLSDEDMALLEEYKDSFMNEVKEIKSALLYKKQKPIDTTVALMNRSSHAEIGLDFTSRVLSNGHDGGIKGVVFYPSAMYYHKTGLYVATSMGFFTDSAISHSAKVPTLFISPGFHRMFFKKWTLNIGYTRSFIFYGVDQRPKVNDFQRGLLNNSIALYNSFDFWRYITLSIGINISWSSNLRRKKSFPLFHSTYQDVTRNAGQAFAANIGISLRKDFNFYNIIGAKIFTVTPELYFLFGQDNGTLVSKARSHAYFDITSDKFFGFLNLEPGLTVDWRIRNLEISAGFHCAIPFNEFVETGGVAGRITNPHHYYPYAEAGIKYLFRIKKKAKKIN